MMHKFCIGLKRLPGINEKWFCDWCHWHISTLINFKPIKLARVQDLYCRSPDVSLQRLKQETIAKNEQIHLARIGERKSDHKKALKNVASVSMFTEHSSSDHQSKLENQKLPKSTLNSKITKQSKKREQINTKNVTASRRNKRDNLVVRSPPLNTQDTYHSAKSLASDENEFDSSPEPLKIHPNSSNTKCLFCFRTGTPMLQINETTFWGHLSCAYWLQEASVDLTVRRIIITEKVFKYAYQQKAASFCEYCPQRKGMVIKCYELTCPNAFHVECGRLTHCEMKLPYHLNSKQKDHVMFCHEHSKCETLRKIESARYFDKVPLRNFAKQFQDSHRFMRSNLHYSSARQVKKINKKQKLIVFLRKTAKNRNATYSYRCSKLI
jgi:hypothetical protein